MHNSAREWELKREDVEHHAPPSFAKRLIVLLVRAGDDGEVLLAVHTLGDDRSLDADAG